MGIAPAIILEHGQNVGIVFQETARGAVLKIAEHETLLMKLGFRNQFGLLVFFSLKQYHLIGPKRCQFSRFCPIKQAPYGDSNGPNPVGFRGFSGRK